MRLQFFVKELIKKGHGVCLQVTPRSGKYILVGEKIVGLKRGLSPNARKTQVATLSGATYESQWNSVARCKP